jgi:hypothetical protein
VRLNVIGKVMLSVFEGDTIFPDGRRNWLACPVGEASSDHFDLTKKCF